MAVFNVLIGRYNMHLSLCWADRRDGYEERTTKVHYREDEARVQEQSPEEEEKTKPTVNGGLSQELEKGIPTLSQDKMSTVRDKKEDIERVRYAAFVISLWLTVACLLLGYHLRVLRNAKLFYINFQPLEILSHYRDP